MHSVALTQLIFVHVRHLAPAQLRSRLEKELKQLRVTKTSMEDLDGGASGDFDSYLGVEGEDYGFDDAECGVEFGSCSALTGNIKSLKKFLSNM